MEYWTATFVSAKDVSTHCYCFKIILKTKIDGDDLYVIIVTFGSIPQSVIGKPQANIICVGTSFENEDFKKIKDFSLKVA